jgi:hypothetical protein
MKISAEDLMILIPVASGFIAALCFLWCIILSFKLRATRKHAAALAEQVADEITIFKEQLETVSTQAADQGRRTAWLESRVRPNTLAAVPDSNKALIPTANLTVTERRHRVLSLARRGMSVHTIAAMLGEMPGEIELIINLSRAA